MENKTLSFISTSTLSFDEHGNDVEVPIDKVNVLQSDHHQLHTDAPPLWELLEEQRKKSDEAKEQFGKSLLGVKPVDEDEAAFLEQLGVSKRKHEQQKREHLERGLEEWEAEQKKQREKQLENARQQQRKKEQEELQQALQGELPTSVNPEELKDDTQGRLFQVGTQLVISKKRSRKQTSKEEKKPMTADKKESDSSTQLPKKTKLSLVDY